MSEGSILQSSEKLTVGGHHHRARVLGERRKQGIVDDDARADCDFDLSWSKRIDLEHGDRSLRERGEELAYFVEREIAAPVLLEESVEELRSDGARSE